MTRKTKKEKIAASLRSSQSHASESKSKSNTSASYSPTETELMMLQHTKKDTFRTLLIMTALVILQLIAYSRIDNLQDLLH